MQVDKYEIDMLNVKAADAFLIHFFDSDDHDTEYIVLVDGGNYNDGKTIAEFIRTNYTHDYIDLAICTHCDKDHYGGIMYLLEQQRDNGEDNMNIREIWVNDPADHVTLGEVKWIRKESTLQVKARSVYDLNGNNMLDVLDELCKKSKIQRYEPFSDANAYQNGVYISSKWNGLIKVLGPSVEFYESLVIDFRNDLKRKDYETDESSDEKVEFEDDKAYSKTVAEAGDDPSPHNQSSVIVKFVPNDHVYLFMGDAGRAAIDAMPNNLIAEIKNIYWLKIPHHGSKYNLDNDVVNHLNPQVAYISTEKYGHYLSKAIVNVLKQLGAKIYTTNINGSMCHHKGTPTHDGYVSATPI